MKEKIKKNIIDILGMVAVIICFIMNCIIICKGTRAFFHSDDATAILFAREQWNQKKMYPDFWNYGTSVWNIGLNTIVIPFLKICKHWMDARICAVITQTAIMVAIICVFKKTKIIGKRWWLVVLLMLLPISEVISEHWYFQATYMSAILMLACMILLAIIFLNSNSRIKKIISLPILAAIMILNIGTGYTMILVYVLPMIAALAILVIQKLHDQVEKKQIKKYVFLIFFIAVCTFVGIIYNKYLYSNLNVNTSSTGNYYFIASTEIGESILNLFEQYVRLFGLSDKPSTLLSISGINKAIAFVYIVFLLFITLSLLKNFKKLKNEAQKIIIIFSIVSSFATIYLFVFTGMLHARYLIWNYFYMIILTGIWIDNFSRFKYEYAKEFKIGVVLFYIVMFIGSYSYYLTYDYKQNPDVLGINNQYLDYTLDYELLDYMEENNYKYGYAYYWASYSYMAASDGKIKMTAINYNWKDKYRWLNSEKEDKYKGECFVLVLDRQLETLPQQYFEYAKRQDHFGNHTIFVYKNKDVIQKVWDSIIF